MLAMREQRDEIARLTAELEGSKMTVSVLKEQQAKTTENTAAEALKGADAKNTDALKSKKHKKRTVHTLKWQRISSRIS